MYFIFKSFHVTAVKIVIFILYGFVFSGCAGVILAGAGAGAGASATASIKSLSPHSKKIEKKTIPPTLKTQPKRIFGKLPTTALITKQPVPKQRKKKKRIFPKLTSLKGLNSKAVLKTLGKPSFVRKDGPAEIWLYNEPNCTIHLIFYKNKQSKSLSVKFLENNMKTASESTCVKTIIERLESKESLS